MSGISLMISDSHGVYVPQVFAEKYDRSVWGPISDWAWENIELGPDHENSQSYWDAWQEILDGASHTDENGNVWRLYQEGDLWAFCDALMTDDEYEQFFGEPRETDGE